MIILAVLFLSQTPTILAVLDDCMLVNTDSALLHWYYSCTLYHVVISCL